MCSASGASHGSSKFSSTTSMQRPDRSLGQPRVGLRDRCPPPGPTPCRRASRGRGSRCWRTRRPAGRRAHPGAPTGAGSTSARCRASAPRPPRASWGPRVARRPARPASTPATSARSDRWTCSTPAEYVAGVPALLGPMRALFSRSIPLSRRGDRLRPACRWSPCPRVGRGCSAGPRHPPGRRRRTRPPAGGAARPRSGASSAISGDSPPTTPRPGKLRADTRTAGLERADRLVVGLHARR